MQKYKQQSPCDQLKNACIINECSECFFAFVKYNHLILHLHFASLNPHVNWFDLILFGKLNQTYFGNLLMLFIVNSRKILIHSFAFYTFLMHEIGTAKTTFNV